MEIKHRKYQKPQAEIIRFRFSDIVVASDAENGAGVGGRSEWQFEDDSIYNSAKSNDALDVFKGALKDSDSSDLDNK